MRTASMTVGGGADDTLGAESSRRRRVPAWSAAALALVGGLAIGRFVTAESDAPPVAAVAGPGVPTAGTLEEQVTALEQTVAADPADARSWRRLGIAYVGLAAQTGDPAYYRLASDAFDEATTLEPNDPTVLVGKGALALSLHDFEAAEQLGEQAIAALPANADALGVLVDAQVELGRYEEAAETLQAMLDARPGLPALARTSYLRELNGDLVGARESMQRAVTAGASSPLELGAVTALLGHLQLAGGDIDAAAAAYQEAERLDPGLLAAELGSAQVAAARGDIAGALVMVEAIVGRFPAPTALQLLADLQSVAGDRQAEDDTIELMRATALLQEEAGQVVDLEMALFEADVSRDPSRAVELARSSYAARPDNVFAADALAWALFRAGDHEAARPFAEQAVRLGTANPLLQYHAAEVFAAVGDDARARTHLEVARRAGAALSIRHAASVDALAARLGAPPSS